MRVVMAEDDADRGYAFIRSNAPKNSKSEHGIWTKEQLLDPESQICGRGEKGAREALAAARCSGTQAEAIHSHPTERDGARA
eukprot:5829226-Alexandrium_andersonii.AAC.1